MADIETINDLKDDEKLSALAERASQIASQIASTPDSSALRGFADELKSLLSAVPIGASGSGSIISRIKSAIDAANGRATEEEAIEDAGGSSLGGGRGPRSAMSMEFQKAIYNQFMSSEEKAYSDQFKAGTQYKMATIDDKGNITEAKDKNGNPVPPVDGAQLKEDFARVKAYSVDPEKDGPNGEKITSKITAEQQAALITADGKKMADLTPAEEIQEITKVGKSLENLEGQKAQELKKQQEDEIKQLKDMGADATEITEVQKAQKEEAIEVRKIFVKAQETIKQTKRSAEAVETANRKGWTEAEVQARDALKSDKKRLSNDLKATLKTLTDDSEDNRKERFSRKGRDKENELENEIVKPANTRAGSVQASNTESKKEADKEVMAAKGDDIDDKKAVQISGGQNVENRDLANLSPVAAGGTRSTAREMS